MQSCDASWELKQQLLVVMQHVGHGDLVQLHNFQTVVGYRVLSYKCDFMQYRRSCEQGHTLWKFTR